jgi:hypothetical protein
MFDGQPEVAIPLLVSFFLDKEKEKILSGGSLGLPLGKPVHSTEYPPLILILDF